MNLFRPAFISLSIALVGVTASAGPTEPSALSAKPTSKVATKSAKTLASDIGPWLSETTPLAEQYLMANLSPELPGYKKGFVMAAPWEVKGVQNYRYHWIRDAALVMNTQVTGYIVAKDEIHQKTYLGKLIPFLNFSKENQTAPETGNAEKVGLGEVKFNPDGTRFTEWMRPQNDGPALRAITVIRLVRKFMDEGKTDLAKNLYDGTVTSQSKSQAGALGIQAPGLIAADLEYIRGHWNDLSYDPWEEVKARHFYVQLVQRKALLDGAALARQLGDSKNADADLATVKEIEPAIEAHWLAAGTLTPGKTKSPGQIWDTFDRSAGADYKTTGLDVAVVLGALHAHNEFDQAGDQFFAPTDDRILATSLEISRAFIKEFPISRKAVKGEKLGVPIGRYPKDKYNGLDAHYAGNPWYLATAAFAELYYRAAKGFQEKSEIKVSKINLSFLKSLGVSGLKEGDVLKVGDKKFPKIIASLHDLGDDYLRRVRHHIGENGHMTEEFSRDDGTPQGAQDLSWSYAALLTAAQVR